jgi:hypothetical protein
MTSERPLYPPLIELNGKVLFRPDNQAQFDYCEAQEPNVFLRGNRGGGKSITARWHAHSLAMAYPGYKYAILRTSFPELIKNHLIFLKQEMHELGGSYHGGQFIARYPNGSMGFYMQAQTEEQVQNALGVEMYLVVFDEAPTFKWEHMMMIGSSVRVPTDSGLIPLKRYLGNPIGTSIDDLDKYFIDKDVDLLEDKGYRPEEYRTIKIRVEDNSHLDAEEYQRGLGVGLPEALRKAWIEGERFDSRMLFELKPTIEVVKGKEKVEIPYHIITELPRAMDEQGNPTDVLSLPWVRIQGCYRDGFIDPAVMLWAVNVGPQIIVFNERVWTHTNSTDIAKEILDASEIVDEQGKLRQLPLKAIYADPVIAKESTAVQSTQQVMEHAWKCPIHGKSNLKRCCNKAVSLRFEPSTDDRLLFASAINRVLKAEIASNIPKVCFLRPDPNSDEGKRLIARGIVGCPYLIKYLPKMQFDLDDARKLASHKHDRPVVAFAYLCMSYPIHTVVRKETVLPSWWGDFFIGSSNIPKRPTTPKYRRGLL